MTITRSIIWTAGMTASLTLGLWAGAQEPPVETTTVGESLRPVAVTNKDAIQARLAALKKIALKAAEVLPENETRILRAVIMEFTGKVQWRTDEKAKWKKAAKDDILTPGAMVRTGLHSWMMLRVGINSHVFVDSGSRVTLPQITHAGDTLKTMVQVNRGRADIEVGQVGLTNDFSVLTPSGALAVRGTGMAVGHSALQGTQVFGARTNAMNAIAMRYYGSKVAHMMSGGAVSTQKTPDPAVAGAMESSGPAPLQATESQDQQDAPDQTTQAVSNANPINQSVRILLADQQEAIADEIYEEEFGDPFIQDGFAWYFPPNGVVLSEDMGSVATALYWDMSLKDVGPLDPYNPAGHRVAAIFESGLFNTTGFHDSSRIEYIHEGQDGHEYMFIPFGVDLPNGDSPIPGTYAAILNYGDAEWTGQPFTGDTELRTMMTFVNEFCVTTFNGDGERIEVCREAFANAMNEVLYNEYQSPGQHPRLTPYGQSLQHGPADTYELPEGGDCAWCP
ncbi:MAG: FecR domain-containing protein [Planctomycetes bacterium]|nr:FecR domain-containing protein [Planctomycetota bacterium]MCP4837995.1 FecR domain-containing protein [Planctomycetota bacterium]